MMKITNLKNNLFFKGILSLILIFQILLTPMKVFAELGETEINGEMINASTEFLRDLDYETWQLVAYKSSISGVKLLGELPLQKQIREEMDKGTPTVSQNPESPTSMAFREIARKMAATLSMRKKDYSSVFPKIVIQND